MLEHMWGTSFCLVFKTNVDSIRDESVNFTVWSGFISNYITQQLKRSKQSRPVMIIYDNDITERSLLSFVQP